MIDSCGSAEEFAVGEAKEKHISWALYVVYGNIESIGYCYNVMVD